MLDYAGELLNTYRNGAQLTRGILRGYVLPEGSADEYRHLAFFQEAGDNQPAPGRLQHSKLEGPVQRAVGLFPTRLVSSLSS